MARVERHGNSWRAVYVGADERRVREVLPAQTKAEARAELASLPGATPEWIERRLAALVPTD